jgi:low temperature requirement protein LtrA
VSSAQAAAEPEERVTTLELFFDLVFVFAITQVTNLMAKDPSWQGLGRGALVLAALWWAWAAYAWLTNTIDPDEIRARLAIFTAMAALLVASLAVPKAFDDDALIFGVAYAVVRALHIYLYAVGSPDVGVRQAILRLAPTSFIGSGLIIVAAFTDGWLQGALWAVALLIDYAGPLIAGNAGFTLHAGHFAERHGLIIIIALGESIVAVGVAATGELTAGVMAAGVLGVGVAAALWWAYFDVVAVVAETRLRETRGPAQRAMARDSYSYLHMPMVLGIVLIALGIKKTLAHVDHPLDSVPVVALCGGATLYLLAHIGFRLRNVGSLNRQRLVVAVVCLALIPLGLEADALVALGALTGVLSLLIAYEAIRFREARVRVRTTGR